MAILHSWCCWRSVRKGSFACGFYTAFYYTITAAHSSIVLHEELEFFKQCPPKSSNNCSDIKQATILDPDTTSESSIIFTLLSLSTSSSGILTSCLLLYGLYKDCKFLLIPWIINIILFTLQDVVYISHQFYEHALGFNPSIAILITLDFFITSLNVYALLCVISQYQELKAGRGRAQDDQNNRVPNIHYSSQPTATSYLSTRRPITYHETRPTPTQSPTGTAPHTSLGTDETSPSIFNKGPRKSVKFPDHSSPNHNGPQLLEPWTIDVKSPMLVSKGADTAPLIETNTDTILQSNL
ncbi:uncharacterized protein LOC103312561 isoform X2 [Tribolium castaneum]|uniref:Uncharacterized protein n=1 Tax=Tribolium castaneum TaxID=7070 RepID=D6WIM9_TRICA|nr:PREDICTED: uncharacterized protein LOC103312561 isoform X2 [Tribolium castaneum]EFA00755.2 hypothetical protein TcasGA2_TC003639 [Tribolium castaneum]|eukprot:XP_008191717.2 PREDICTED: uncharacterized protein LOC103312561 isoform X2 [Tribolium castaneum]